MLKNKKTVISLLIILAIIIIGIVTIVTEGFDYSLEYSTSTELKIVTGAKDIQINDVKEITNSILQNEKSHVQIIEDIIYITSRNITEEQKSEILSKVKEKYSLDISEEQMFTNQKMKLNYLDIIYIYISPVIISTIVILVYFAIKYKKQNWLKVIGITLGAIIVVEALAVSVIAIARIPVSMLTMPILLGLYILTVLVLTYMFEKNK